MQRLTRTLAMASALAFAGVLAGCGDDVTVSQPTTVTVTPPSASVAVGGAVTFTASVTGDIANKTVTWASSDASKATVDANGKVVGVAVGNSTITATAAGDANAKASALVTVTAVTKGVTKVEVSPNNQIIKIGDFLQLTANVSRDPGVAGTVTWTSSAAAVATVDATGKVTGVTNGSAVITAASTVDPTVTGTMALTVRPTTPAQISIQKITTAGNLGAPVNFNAVAGQIDVTLNLNPGDQTVTKVEVLIDNVTACSQNLSVAESEQLRLAAEFSDVAAIDVVCSINTAAFNATTGVPAYLNGVRNLTAKATIGGTQPGNVATPSQALTFTNANGFVATQTLGGTTASATSTAGFAFKRGSLSVSVLPVVYNAGQAVAAGTLSFGSAACDASGGGVRSVALVAPAAGSSAWTATLGQTDTDSPANTANDVSTYEFNGTCAATATGETFTITATDNAGNTIYTAVAPANAPTLAIRLDNRAPAAPAVLANVNGRANGWVNDAVSFNTVSTGATSNNMITAAITDGGVGGVTYAAKAGTTLALAIAAADIANPTSLAPSNPNAYCLVAYSQDALGNRSASPTGTTCTGANTTTIGVDRWAPVATYDVASMANAARKNGASIGGEFVVTVVDTGTVGNSGMLAGSPVKASVIRREADGTSFTTAPQDCVVGTLASSNTVCRQSTTGLAAPTLPTVATAITALNVAGYYTYSGAAFDAAGNSTPLASDRVIVYDGTAPAMTPASVSLASNFYNGGVAQQFQSLANDNLDVWKADFQVAYNAVVPDIFSGTTLVNGFNAATLLTSNVPVNFTVPFFYRQMQIVTGNNPIAVGAATKPSAIVGSLFDQGNNSSGAVTTPIPPGSVVTPTSAAYPGAGPTLMNSWAVTTAAATIGDGSPVVAPAVATTPTSITLTAEAVGPTATFQPPFSRVDFYVNNGGVLKLIGTVNAPTTTDDGSANGRKHKYSLSWTPGTAFGAGGPIFAIGSTANGDALSTPAGAAITIQP